jgi:glycerate dehydrogenase
MPRVALAGLTMGIVGCRPDRHAVARRALAFEMKVLAHTRTEPPIHPPGVEFTDLGALFRESDSSAFTSRCRRRRSIGQRKPVALMKPTAWLVNTAAATCRGDRAGETSTRKAIAGAALDVLSAEPPPPDHPLFRVPNCLSPPTMPGRAVRPARA